MQAEYPYSVEFFLEEDGSSPVIRWITEELTAAERRAVTAALRELLAAVGQDVCKTDFGKNLGGGLIELRLRQSEAQILKRLGRQPADHHPEDVLAALLIRVFFHAHGEKRILILHGYSKSGKSSRSYQQRQISIARGRLTQWKRRQEQHAKLKRRQGPK